MSNFACTATDEKWTHDELLVNSICHFCNRQYHNDWFSCNRRSSMVNLHPGLASLKRHYYYVVKIISKFVLNPYSRISFSGHPGAETTKQTYTIPHVSLPKQFQTKIYITHGERL